MKCLSSGKHATTFVNCSNDELQAIINYRTKFMNHINNQIKSANRSIWSIACSDHVYAIKNADYDVDYLRVPQQTGLTLK